MGASESGLKRDPFLDRLSPNVEVLYGFADAHATIKVRTPVGVPVSVDVSSDDIARVKEHFEKAHAWSQLPTHERTGKDPVEVELRSDAKVKYGFADLHIELGIRKVVWIWLNFPHEEFLLAKRAFENAHAWASMPREIRELQGVAD